MSAVALRLVDGAVTVSEIQRHHELAQRHAEDAVEHARQAGALLLQQKATTGHGGWLEWVAANVTFTARTAQRYMTTAAPPPKIQKRHAVAYRKPAKLGSKRAEVAAECDAAIHRTEVLSHAAYLVAELPTVGRLDDASVEMLTALRAKVDALLNGRPQ